MNEQRSVAERPPLVITDRDRERLRALVLTLEGGALEEAADRLSTEIERAEVVPADAIPPDVVTLHACVRFEDESTGKQREVMLVFPHEADPWSGRISILAPVGIALLGLRVGQRILWELPNGKEAVFLVREVVPPSVGVA